MSLFNYARQRLDIPAGAAGSRSSGPMNLTIEPYQPYSWENAQVDLSNVPGTAPVDVTLPNQITTADLGGEGINTGLQNALGNISSYLEQTGGPQYYQGDVIADFTDAQRAGQESLVGAASDQDTLAGLQQDFISDTLAGQYDVSPRTYLANQQGQADYVNEYLNPLVQQAQQQAIGNVNSSFGSAGTLGSARNADAAARAALSASLPTLAQGAQTEFAANQAINRANQAALNQAAQYNTSTLNQGDQYNNALAQQAVGIIPTAQGSATAGGSTLQQVGQQQQDLNQALINEQIKAFNYNQQQPLNNLNQQVALAQIAQAAQGGNIGADISGGGGLNFGDILGGLAGGGSNPLGSIGSFLGGLFNEGGEVKSPTVKRKY